MGDYDVVDSEGGCFIVHPSMAVCSECGEQLELTIWGEGIDSGIECTGCDERDIYR